MGQGKIRLVQRGSCHASKWLVGADIPDCEESRRNKRAYKAKITKLICAPGLKNNPDLEPATDFSGGIVCAIKRSNGTREEISYETAIEALFSLVRSKALMNGMASLFPAYSGQRNLSNIDVPSNPFFDITLDDEVMMTSAAVTEEAEVDIPKVGDHVRMLFSQQDLFVAKHTMWFIGTITLATKNNGAGYTLKIQWGDTSEDEHAYPNKELELLLPEISLGPSAYVSSRDATALAFDRSPNVLSVGDHVQCFYQNGLSKGQWWPGRVAKVNTDDNRVDIAYLDGEVRCMHRQITEDQIIF